MTPIQKAKLLSEHFFMAGYGHFDLTIEDVGEIINILEKSDKIKEDLKNLYERLSKIRLG